VPIPGEPCRNEAELTAASRVTDDFSLELRFEPPKQSEEKAARKFVEKLKHIKIIESGVSIPLDKFIKAIRDEWRAPSSPPITSPPEVLQIHADDFRDYLRAVFRLWVTELRNEASDRKTGCAVEMSSANKIEDCVLLAELRIPLQPLSTGWKVGDTKEIEIIEENRPFLLHLRMLQELMFCGCQCKTESASPITSPSILNPSMSAAHGHSLSSLSDVAASSPTDGQILIFRGRKWTAEKPPESESTQFPLLLPLATVNLAKPDGIFDIWFNIDAPNNLAEIREGDLKMEQIIPQIELEERTNPDSPFLQEVSAQELERLGRNLFRIQLKGFSQDEIPKLRFDFDIENINIFTGEETAVSIQKYARKHNIRFLGESKNKVTVFVSVPKTLVR
jgi:hypothetical protein